MKPLALSLLCAAYIPLMDERPSACHCSASTRAAIGGLARRTVAPSGAVHRVLGTQFAGKDAGLSLFLMRGLDVELNEPGPRDRDL